MVVKFQVQQQRGAAGQGNTQGRQRNYNFQNLYSLNKNNYSGDKLNQMHGKANDINKTMQDQNTLAIKRGGVTQGSSDSMSAAVQRAKGLSNEAQGFDPAADARKAGNSAFQSSTLGFYGGNPDTTQKIRKFGGIYGAVTGKQASIQGRYNNGQPGIAVQPKRDEPKSQYGRQFQTAAEQAGYNASNPRNAARGDTQLTTMNNLDWGLKTGRISAQDYYKAQNDPQYYRYLADWLSKQ